MDTYGWDTVFVADIATINAAMAVKSAEYSEPFNFNQDGTTVTGKFGPWQIVPGGSGKLLNLQIELQSGTLTVGSKTIDLAGVLVVSQVSLNFLPNPTVPNGQQLKFNFKSAGKAPGDGVVTPVSVDPETSGLSPIQETVVGMAVSQCLVSSADKVSFVFASINPVADSSTAWLHPASCGYAYISETGTDKQLLAIFGSSAKETGSFDTKVDPALLKAGTNSGIAISAELFLLNVFAPALAQSFNTSASNFELQNYRAIAAAFAKVQELLTHKSVDVNALVARHADTLALKKQINMSGIKSGAITYTPVLKSLNATVSDTLVKIKLSGSVDMKMNISMDFSSASNIAVMFDASRHKFEFKLNGTPIFHKETHIPWYDHLLDIFGALPEIILQTCVALIGSDLGNKIGAIAGAQNITSSAANVVHWLDGQTVTPTEGGLAGALYLQGNIK